MFGIDDALIAAGANVIGGLFTNESNQDIASANNAFNAEQAGLTRDFNAGQADLNRSFNAGQAEINRQFEANQQSINRDYQLNVSNTAYQRGVKDLIAAGLNPMLAYTRGGASTPTGGAASGGAATGQAASTSAAQAAHAIPMRNPLADAANSALATAQIQTQQAQTAALEAQARKTTAETYTELNRPENIAADTQEKRGRYAVSETQQRLNTSSANKVDQEVGLVSANIDKAVSEINLIKEQTTSEQLKQVATKAATQLTNAQELYTRGQITIQQFTKMLTEAEAMIKNNNVVGAAQEAKFQSVFGMLQRIIRTVNPLAGLISP